MAGPSIKSVVRPVNSEIQATVSVSGTASDEIDLGGDQLVGIFVPSTFDGTNITLTASPTSGGTFVAVQNGDGDSGAYTITTTASRFVPIDNLAITAGLRFVKLVCATAQSTSPTIFTLATRPI